MHFVRRYRQWILWTSCSLLLGCQSADPPVASNPDLPTATVIVQQPTALPPTATATPQPSPTAPPPTETPTPQPSPTMPPPTETAIPQPTSLIIENVATKPSQAYKYSCEFDAAWVILETYGIQTSVDELIARIPIDSSVEPWFDNTVSPALIYGGDIQTMYSGDYRTNFLARTTGGAMSTVFTAYGLETVPVHSREEVLQALGAGNLIWIKTTVDFAEGVPALWQLPNGGEVRTVLGNDHAVVIMGATDEAVLIRDVLGPTSSNWSRLDEYYVDWNTFMHIWEQQGFDGLAVIRPASPPSP